MSGTILAEKGLMQVNATLTIQALPPHSILNGILNSKYIERERERERERSGSVSFPFNKSDSESLKTKLPTKDS